MRNDQAIKFKNLKRGQFLHSNFLYTDYTLDYTLASLERIGAKTGILRRGAAFVLLRFDLRGYGGIQAEAGSSRP